MAGHPTLGTAYVLAKQQNLQNDNQVTLTLEEGVGPVPVTLEIENGEPGLITMQQPLPTFSEPFNDRKRPILSRLMNRI